MEDFNKEESSYYERNLNVIKSTLSKINKFVLFKIYNFVKM